MSDAKHLLEISVYDGEFAGDVTSLTQLCVIEGSVTPHDREPYSPLEETRRLLELGSAKYVTPAPSGACFTVLIDSKDVEDAEAEPLIRLDVYAHNGEAHARVISRLPPWDTEGVRYDPEDSAVTIALNVLRGNLRVE